jgi:hypothetical protein
MHEKLGSNFITIYYRIRKVCVHLRHFNMCSGKCKFHWYSAGIDINSKLNCIVPWLSVIIETPSWKSPIYGMLGLISVFRTSNFSLYSEPNTCSPHIPELLFQDAFQSFHLWLYLPSSLSFSRLQSTFQNLYVNHMVTLSRKQLNVGHYLDQQNNVYINPLMLNILQGHLAVEPFK